MEAKVRTRRLGPFVADAMFLCVYQTPISCPTKQDRYRKLAKEHITPARASMRQQEAIFVWGWLTDMQREGEIVTTVKRG